MAIVDDDAADWEDIEGAAKRSIGQHMLNSFVRTYKSVLDDAE